MFTDFCATLTARTRSFLGHRARLYTINENIPFLRNLFEDRISSLNTGTIWPPLSCKLTPCDFYLQPYLKNSISKIPVVDLDDLHQRITNKIEEINNIPWILQNVVKFVKRIVDTLQSSKWWPYSTSHLINICFSPTKSFYL